AEPDFPHRLAAYHASQSVGEPVPASSVFQSGRMISLFVVFGGFIVVLSVGAVLLVVFLALAKKLPQVGYPPQGLTQAVSDRFAFRMALYLIAYFGGVIALLSAIPLALPLMVRAMIGMGLFAFVLLGLLAIPFDGMKDSIRGLIGVTDRPWRLVGAGLWAWLAVTPLVLLFALVMTQVFSWLPTPSHPTTVDIAEGSNMLDVFATYAVAAVLAPFLEELTFRGLLFPALKRWMGWFAAAALSGLVFAAVHPQGPLLWLSLGSIGAASAVVAQYTGSLVPSFVLHAANNAAVLTLAMVVFG
ncbi:MAG: lysostaphin resistance A-like protein, partial [Fimbriimonadaceae bacterium]